MNHSSPARRLGAAENLAHDLEQCIRATAANIAELAGTYDDHCLPPAEKAALEAKAFEATLTGMRARHGYAAALWCAFYAVPMPGWPYMADCADPGLEHFCGAAPLWRSPHHHTALV